MNPTDVVDEADVDLEEFETLLAQVLAAEAKAANRRTAAGVEAIRRSKHAYRLVQHGQVIGWRSHTKATRTAAERRRARKAQRAARKANR